MMANEFKHVSVGGDLTQSEWEAVATHIANGQTAGDILYFDGTYWKRRPYNTGARVYHSANQSIPDNTWTTLAFNSERWDTDTIHDPSTNNSRLTCKTAGVYLFIATARFDQNSVGGRGAAICINGSWPYTLPGYHTTAPHTSADATIVQAVGIYPMSVNDYAEMRVWQASGGALSVLNAFMGTEFMMQRIG
jgi:hypothetical protein